MTVMRDTRAHGRCSYERELARARTRGARARPRESKRLRGRVARALALSSALPSSSSSSEPLSSETGALRSTGAPSSLSAPNACAGAHEVGYRVCACVRPCAPPAPPDPVRATPPIPAEQHPPVAIARLPDPCRATASRRYAAACPLQHSRQSSPLCTAACLSLRVPPSSLRAWLLRARRARAYRSPRTG